MSAAALLGIALGLALAFAPGKVRSAGVCVWIAVCCASAFSPWPRAWETAIFVGGCIGVLANAAVVHLLRELRPAAALALCANAGFWSGAVIALAGSPGELFVSIPCVLVVLPAAWVMRRWRSPIILKTVASWLIVVALLIASLHFLPVTPGFLPDHLD